MKTTPYISNLGRICGAVGVVLLVSTPLTWLLTSTVGPLVLAKLLSSVFLLGFYLATNREFFAKLAGARSSGLMALSATTIVLVLGLTGVVNFVAYKNPKEFDFTRENLYTLSDQTMDLLGRLKDDVRISAFFASDEAGFDEIKQILDRYAKHSSHVTVEMTNPQSRPDLVEKYNITDEGPRIVITARDQEARPRDASEQELTNAIMKVAEQTSKTIWFLTGHGERDLSDADKADGAKQLSDAIAADGYAVQTFSFIAPEEAANPGDKVKMGNAEANKLSVPDKVQILVINGPQSPLLEPEITAISDFLQRGGRVMVMLDPHIKSGLEPLLHDWKIDVHNDIIVDTNPLNRLMGLGPAAPLLQPVEAEHVITKEMVAPAVLPTTRSLGLISEGEPGITSTALVVTGETAWGETNIDKNDGTASRDDLDNLPPLYGAVVAIKATKDLDATKLSEETRIVVMGDSDWASNKYLTFQGNSDFALNSINWLAEQEDKISIRPKKRESSQLFLSGDDMGKLKFFSMDLLPVLLVAAGFGIVIIRRQK